MRLAILHLTDLHLKADHAKNPILSRCKEIADSIKLLDLPIDCVRIVIGGDTAQGGQDEEFSHGIRLYQELSESIANLIEVDTPIVIAVAGNHDCDFSKGQSKLRETTLANLSSLITDSESLESIAAPLNNYYSFREQVCQKSITQHCIAYSTHDCLLNNQTVRFHLVDSSWMSLRRDEPRLTLPFDLIEESFSSLERATFNILVIHHPISCSFLKPLENCER